jgi:hypothetical protein
MEVRRSVVAGAGVALVALIAAVAFLLGRESMRGPVAPAPVAPAPVAAPAPIPADAAAVRDYFAEVAKIQSFGATGDASALAQQLLASEMGGDPAGFDALIKGLQDGAERARRLRVPAACADFQKRLLALLDDSDALMRSLRAALTEQDGDALLSFGQKAGDLQTRATALDADGRSIRARYGLAN